MFRALSTRRSHGGGGGGGYERLVDDPSSTGGLEANLSRARSLPAKALFGLSSKNTASDLKSQAHSQQAKKASKTHPLFSLFDVRRRKKTTAKPEFARYLEYVKEGGIWDSNSNMPVIYYK